MFRTVLPLVAWVGALAAIGAPATLSAQSPEDPALARSELTAPKKAPAGEPIELTMILRSDADEPAEVWFSGSIGDRFLFAGAADGSGVQFDPAERSVSWRGTVPAHGEQRFAFSVAPPLWLSGSGIVVTTAARRTSERDAVYRNAFVEIGESRRSRDSWGVRVGPVIVGPYEIVLLVALSAALAFTFWLKRRLANTEVPAAFAAGGGIVAFMVLTGAGLLGVDGTRTLLTDIGMIRTWEPVPCTVVDAAAVYDPPSSGGKSGSKTPKGSYAPLAVVRYRAGGTPRTALGFWSDSHIFVSRRAERLAAPYRPGTAATCWVNPADRGQFVLDRTPGFGHVGLILIVALLAGAAWLPFRIRRKAAPEESSGPLLGQ